MTTQKSQDRSKILYFNNNFWECLNSDILQNQIGHFRQNVRTSESEEACGFKCGNRPLHLTDHRRACRLTAALTGIEAP